MDGIRLEFWGWGCLSLFLHYLFLRSQLGFLDVPNSRSLHDSPTKKSAGIVFGLLFGIGLLALAPAEARWPTLLGFSLFWALGLLDDFLGLPVLLRLFLELSFFVFWLYFSQKSLQFLGVPFSGLFVPIVAILFVYFINLVNFMDGMDGYAGLNFLLFLAFAPGLFSLGPSTQTVAFVFLFSFFGFLVFNLPHAKFFMGDVGSLSLGFFWVTLPFLEDSSSPFELSQLFYLCPWFWIDGTFTIAKRLLEKKNILQAHREHIYQRLTATKLGKRGSLVVCLFLSLPGLFCGIYFLALPPDKRFLALACVLGFYICLYFCLSRFLTRLSSQNFLGQAHPSEEI